MPRIDKAYLADFKRMPSMMPKLLMGEAYMRGIPLSSIHGV